MTTTVTAARPTTRRRTGPVAVYLFTTAALALGAALLVPDYVIEPMGRMTHYMALIGPENPAHPWTLLFGMGGMVIAYALIIPYLVGLLPEGAARVGTLLLAALTASFAAYLLRWVLGPMLQGTLDSHGAMDVVSLVALALTPVPLVAASVLLLATGRLNGQWVYYGAALLHVGMLTGMLAADLVGGAGGAPHVG
jgi:hypothetical protein